MAPRGAWGGVGIEFRRPDFLKDILTQEALLYYGPLREGVRLPGSVRILMLSIVNPAEHNGAASVTRGLLKLLASPPLEAQVDCVPVRSKPLRYHRLAQARSLFHGSVSTVPAKASFLYSQGFRETVVARMENERYDLVILNGTDLVWILDDLPESIPRILVAHNIEHLLFSSQIQNLGRLYRPLAGLLRKDCKRLKDYEVAGIRKIGRVVFLSDREAEYAHRLCVGLHSTTIPPVFDYRPTRRQNRKPNATLQIGLLGNFGWWPNDVSRRWFASEVLPFLKSPVQVHLFGNRGSRNWRNDPRIVEHGEVERIEEVWATCDFMICPALSTFGVCVKLAEAVYNGIPVLATRLAARGLSVNDDPALVFLDEATEWIEFLNSSSARGLAERQVSEKTGALFAVDTHRDWLQQFVRGAISTCDAPP